MMFSVGVLYMLLSICCMKRLRDKLQRDDRKNGRTFERPKSYCEGKNVNTLFNLESFFD